MSALIRILRAAPLTTVQDLGRPKARAIGLSASGPMDRSAYAEASALLGQAGDTALEFTRAGLALTVDHGAISVAWAGGTFRVRHNTDALPWPGMAEIAAGDLLEIEPGPAGNYGYLRFDAEAGIDPVLGSRATHLTARIGGLDGRALKAGDTIAFSGEALPVIRHSSPARPEGPIRVVWSLHADLFSPTTRQRFVSSPLRISSRLDRMGVRLEDRAGVFAGSTILSLVSDAIVPGDIQILGDGTPIVLMRDHQTTGGYPRIATVISADLDRFAQLRPGSDVRFMPVTLDHAQAVSRSAQ
ncbi:Allophanate hydrolase subunit 2 [Devosia enhydra]|uniref:Allophanate hydrolase subunit 2 n=1 Tax=Devosia enhydra TaxID=665118 RepID=A0A1K2HUE1_9HYPH|nr:biotin-dependent carboxyltransferase family protein [Devosia enhydra]SFZ82028.1 Allophanate hydrolase subunit 2 [Devosia enhydra]